MKGLFSSGPKSNREHEWEEISKENMQEISPEVKHVTFRLKTTLSFCIRNEQRPNQDPGNQG